jgi:hypothetical protein
MAKRSMRTDRPKVDRRVPSDFDHVTKFPGRQLRMIQRTVENVEKTFTLTNRYIDIYDQGSEGACVGFGESIHMSLLNHKLYDALWLYHRAQARDEYPDTPPADGTSLRAGFDVLRDEGHRRLWSGQSRPPEIDEGIVDVNRWLTTVDEVRTAIADGKPVTFGINWYDGFYEPSKKRVGKKTEAWFVPPDEWGSIAGGHCICCIGASDKRQALLFQNSWGRSLFGINGRAWMAYDTATRLLSEDGEAAIVTDR